MEPPAAARTRPKRLRLPGVLGVCCCCWGGPPGSQLDEDEEEINEEEIDEEERSDEEGDYGEDDWYDICVRRPLLGVAGARAIAISVVHHPDRTTDSFTYRQPSVPGGCCHLAIGSYAEDTEPTQISSGLAVWDASVHLCRHLLADPDLCRTKRVLELGSGTGKAGLLAHHLRKDAALLLEDSVTMLTDGDVNALANLRRNVRENTPQDDGKIAVRQLIWGHEHGSTRSFRKVHGKFGYVFGSDLLYSDINAIRHLLQTVKEVMADGGKFVMVHTVRTVRLKTILREAKFRDLLYEIVERVGDVHVIVFRRMAMSAAGPLIDRLHQANDGLRKEIDALRSANTGLENRTRCLDKRIAELRSDVQFDIAGLDEDAFIGVSTFLDMSDLAKLAAACRHFGLKTHRIRPSAGRLVTFVEKTAYNEFTMATDKERQCLPVYDPEDDDEDYPVGTRSLLFYRKGLLELRKPLVFDQLLGSGITHSFEDRARIVSAGRVKVAPLWHGRAIRRGEIQQHRSLTCASRHTMRTGRHYALFTFSGIHRSRNSELQVGIVRPLGVFGPARNNFFSPFCPQRQEQLRALAGGGVDACMYSVQTGRGRRVHWSESDPRGADSTGQVGSLIDWQGMEAFGTGNIGLLLDLDRGSLAVYKNGRRLGVMIGQLQGDYVWAVVCHHPIAIDKGGFVRIDRKTPPSLGYDGVEKKFAGRSFKNNHIQLIQYNHEQKGD